MKEKRPDGIITSQDLLCATATGSSTHAVRHLTEKPSFKKLLNTVKPGAVRPRWPMGRVAEAGWRHVSHGSFLPHQFKLKRLYATVR